MDVAHVPGSWIWHLKESFAWLARFSARTFGLTASSSLIDWLTFAVVDGRWKGRVRRAIAFCRSYRQTHASTAVWHATLRNLMTQKGVVLPLAGPDTQELPWTCEHCGAKFSSKRALAMHAVQLHDYQTLVKHYARDGRCPNCSRDYHCRARLCAHLRTADHCLARIVPLFLLCRFKRWTRSTLMIAIMPGS